MTCLLIAEGPLTYRGPNFQARLTNIILRHSIMHRVQSDRDDGCRKSDANSIGESPELRS
jgi:hypothetical protein